MTMNQPSGTFARIGLTRPLLPPVAKVTPLLAEIWENRVLSNGGPIARRFERALEAQLGWHNVAAVASCTIGMQLLLAAYDLEGDVIVPALTHPATYQAVRWNGLRPIAVDVDKDYLTLDPERVAEAVTENTSAILAVHLFGNPADVTALERVADEHGLVLVFDAASAIGVDFNGVPLTRYGDASSISFHCTKLLGTGEGGAVTTKDPTVAETVRSLSNFGLSGSAPPSDRGTNGKLSELACALGLAALPYLAEEIRAREAAVDRYRRSLDDLEGVEFVPCRPGTSPNFTYAALRLRRPDGVPLASNVQAALDARSIDSRRYFGHHYRSRLDRVGETPVADMASEDLLCVPLWGGMPTDLIDEICLTIRETVANESATYVESSSVHS